MKPRTSGAHSAEPQAPPIDGIVLAGGSSRRMGTDKALLSLGGERLVDRLVRRLAPVCRQVVVASGRRTIPGLEVAQVGDRVAQAGPLAGILAGMEALEGPANHALLCAVVAVDLPDASGEVLRRLAQIWNGSACAVLPLVQGEPQPLHAVYAMSAGERLARLLAAGETSPRRACARLGCQLAGPERWADVDPAASFACNLNRPDDLARWRQLSS